jgi:hypothetical protein
MPISLQTVLPLATLLAAYQEAPEPFLVLASLGIGIGLGSLAWVRETAGWKRGLAKFVALLVLVMGIGMVVIYLVQVERMPLVRVLPLGVALALILWGLANSTVGRRLVRILAVPALAIGAGLLALGIPALVLGKPPIEDPGDFKPLREAFATLSLGAGFLVAGLLALGLSFWGSRKKEDYYQ